MATTIEAPAQHERDLRSANKEWKRGKDSVAKWSHGTRPLSGCGMDWVSGEAVGGSESQRAKGRPLGKHSEQYNNAWKNQQNVNKLNHGHHWTQPHGRIRSKIAAQEEMEDASAAGYRPLSDLLPSLAAHQADNVLYNFDRVDSPGRSLTLDVFVKPATARETERFIEREYEILDERGDALRGRKARQTLRKAASGGSAAEPERIVEDEDGFELV